MNAKTYLVQKCRVPAPAQGVNDTKCEKHVGHAGPHAGRLFEHDLEHGPPYFTEWYWITWELGAVAVNGVGWLPLLGTPTADEGDSRLAELEIALHLIIDHTEHEDRSLEHAIEMVRFVAMTALSSRAYLP